MPASGLPTPHTLLLAIYNVELRFVIVIPVYVNLLHSGAFVAYSGVTLVSFLFVAVSFRLVPVYSGTILVHSVSFRHHSGLLRYIPVPFLSIPFHSAVFRYIPFRFIPFLCLVTPDVKTHHNKVIRHAIMFHGYLSNLLSVHFEFSISFKQFQHLV